MLGHVAVQDDILGLFHISLGYSVPSSIHYVVPLHQLIELDKCACVGIIFECFANIMSQH